MNGVKTWMRKQSLTSLFPFLLAGMLGFGLLLASFQIDNSLLFVGFEIPKVRFVQWLSIAIIMATLLYFMILLVRDEEIPDMQGLMFLPLVLLIISVGSLTQEVTRSLLLGTENVLYFTLVGNPSEPMSQAIFGSFFREQGLITMLLIITALWFIGTILRRSGVFVLIGFAALSGFLHTILGLQEFYAGEFSIDSTFGQNNFFSGHVLIGLLCGVLILVHFSGSLIQGFRAEQTWQRVGSFLAFLCLLFHIFASTLVIVLSESNFTLLIAGFALLVYIIQGMLRSPKIGMVSSGIIFLSTFLGTLYGMLRGNVVAGVDEFRLSLWNAIYKVFVQAPLEGTINSTTFLFGRGFDTLGETLQEYGYYTDVYVDRAHNLYLDMLASVGVLGFLVFFILISYIGYKFWQSRHQITVFDSMVIIIFVSLLARVSVHTLSIITVVEIGIWLMLSMWVVRQSRTGLPHTK